MFQLTKEEYYDILRFQSETLEFEQGKYSKYLPYAFTEQGVEIVRYGKNKKDYDDSYAEIYALYVDKKFKGKKVGTKLVNYVFNILKKDYKYCLISTLKENSANTFYKKIGGIYIGESDFKLNDKIYKENIYKYKL